MADQDNPYRASGIAPGLLPIAPQLTRVPMILGILLLILGGFGAIGMVLGMFVILSPDAFQIPEASRQAMDMTNPLLYVGFAFGIATVICELIAAVGLLKYRMWGRKFAYIYAVLAIVGAFWSIIQQRLTYGQLTPPNIPAGMESFAIGSMVIGLLITLTLPIVCLIYMGKQKVISALS